MKISSYHFHIYFNLEDKEQAVYLREHLSSEFGSKVRIGKLHEQKVGPHTKPMFQVVCPSTYFISLYEEVLLQRGKLSVLIHPETGNDLNDHTIHAVWMGSPIELDLSRL